MSRMRPAPMRPTPMRPVLLVDAVGLTPRQIGADTPYSVNYLAKVVQEAMGKETGVVHLDARQEVVHAFSDHSKSRRILGPGPGISLEDGIREMAEWARSIGPRASSVFDGIGHRRGPQRRRPSQSE